METFTSAINVQVDTRDKEEANIDNEVEKLKSQYQLIEEKYKSLVG